MAISQKDWLEAESARYKALCRPWLWATVGLASVAALLVLVGTGLGYAVAVVACWALAVALGFYILGTSRTDALRKVEADVLGNDVFEEPRSDGKAVRDAGLLSALALLVVLAISRWLPTAAMPVWMATIGWVGQVILLVAVYVYAKRTDRLPEGTL